MEIRAAEISNILKQQIENFGNEADVTEVGTVLSVGDGVARSRGGGFSGRQEGRTGGRIAAGANRGR